MPEPADVADLYGLPLDRFTAERDALAKRLRAEGKRDDATRASKVRRPPLTAWALNQVARDAPQLIEAVLAAGAELRTAMQDAVDGDASSLRPAQAGERSAVDAVLARAMALLGSAGHAASDTARQRMASTVRAAIVDDSAATLLSQGTLDADREAPGFGIGALSSPRTTERGGAEVTDDAEDGKAAEAEDGRAAEARAGQVRQARARLEELTAEADRLAGRAQRMNAAAEEAERVAAQARRGAQEADAEAAAACQAVDGLKSELRALMGDGDASGH